MLTGCSAQEDESIRFGISTSPVTLDPRFATDAVSDRIVSLIYTRLVDFDEHDHPRGLSANWKLITPTHYRFRLRDQFRRFHDGSRLQAADVVATYQSVLNVKTASPHRSSLMNIDSILAVDDETIDFHLKQADPLFPGRLVLGILPKGLLEQAHPFNTEPLGSGPFKLLAWPSPGKLQLQRLHDGQVVSFVTVKDPTVRALKLVRGELDLFQGEIPYDLLPWLADQKQVEVLQTSGSTFSYLGFNLTDPILKNADVRRAIAMAIDRDQIIEFVFRNAARPANGLFPPEHWVGSVEGGVNYDPLQSRQLLKGLGIDQTSPLRLVYKTSSNPFRVKLATVIQAQLREVGVELSIQSLDWGTFYADIKAGRFQMYSLSWVGLKLPDAFRYIFHSDSVPPAGANRGLLNDTQLDQMIVVAEKVQGVSKQTQAYQAIQARLLQTLPVIPLWYEDVVLISRASTRHYTLLQDGSYAGLVKIQRVKNAD